MVSVEYKIPEVYCHYRKVMVLRGMETSGNTRHDYDENGRGAVEFGILTRARGQSWPIFILSG